MADSKVQAGDWVVIAVYFVFCIGLGIWSKFRKPKKGEEGETAEGYFLAGRSMLWWAVGGSLFASNIGSEHFVGLAGSGAATGIGVVAYEWQASWILLLLGFFFVPIYLRSKVFTMPEYLKHRFQSKWMRAYLTVVSLISYVTTKISVDLYAGGLFLKEALGWNIYLSSAVMLVITAVYVLLGGLAAVIYTDVLQCTIMIIGALALSSIGFEKIGGINALWEKFPKAIGESIHKSDIITKNVTKLINATVFPTLAGGAQATATVITYYNQTMEVNTTVALPAVSGCYKPVKNFAHMFRPVDDNDFPWPGLWFSLPVTGIWYWCTDQVIVQRTLSSKNIAHARGGTIFAGFLKILPMYIMVMPGMISRILFADVVGCADPDSCLKYCNNKYGCSNSAYPKLVLNVLPQGAVGLMLAVMMAALMSSLSSAFNSASTIFTIDIWKIFRPRASEREQLIVGRVIVCVLVVIGFVWIPVVSSGHGGQLFVYLQTIQSYLAPPACAVFLIGMTWPRLTEAGALSSMVIGLVLGGTRLIMDVVYPQPHCGEVDNRPGFVKLHFMYYAIILFCVCVVVMVTLSFFTSPVPLEDLGALTWPTINKPRFREGKSSAEYVVTVDLKADEAQVANAYGPKGEEKHNMNLEAQIEDHSRADLAKNDKLKTPEQIKEEHRKELEEIELFEQQSTLVDYGLKGFAIVLLATLAFLWIWYR